MESNNTCMGIYPFEEPYKYLYANIIKPLVQTHTGLTYIDAASFYEGERVKIDLIEQMIFNARVIIADISLKNPHVFYELGIVRALHKPMIILRPLKKYL